VQTLFVRLDDVDMADLERQFAALEAEGRAALEQSGIPTDRVVFERAADMRYVGQEHAVSVRLPAYVGDEAARDEIKRLFDDAHQLRYSHSATEESADVVSLRVTAVGRLTKPRLPEIAAAERTPPAAARKASRQVVFGGHGPLETAVYDRQALRAGNVIEGPAVIEEAASTTVLEPGDSATINPYGHIVLQLA